MRTRPLALERRRHFPQKGGRLKAAVQQAIKNREFELRTRSTHGTQFLAASGGGGAAFLVLQSLDYHAITFTVTSVGLGFSAARFVDLRLSDRRLRTYEALIALLEDPIVGPLHKTRVLPDGTLVLMRRFAHPSLAIETAFALYIASVWVVLLARSAWHALGTTNASHITLALISCATAMFIAWLIAKAVR